MTRFIKIWIFFCLLLVDYPLFAYTRVYLIPEYESSSNNIILSQICRIEGGESSILGNLKLPEALYRDGIIDRKELQAVISTKLTGGYFILGNGVKITKIDDNEAVQDRTIVMKKGDIIKIVIKNRSIKVRINGKSLSDGAMGDDVLVYLGHGKKVYGKIVHRREVVVDL